MPETFRAHYEGHSLKIEKSSVREDVLVTLDHPGYSRRGYVRTDGVALRDALLEAFPLDEPTLSGAAGRLADWEKELLAGLKAEKKPERYAPGTIVRAQYRGARSYIILPDGYYDMHLNQVFPAHDFEGSEVHRVIFDPRGAKALPSPLGIRVGDRVERTKDGITISFEVGHIGDGTKHLFAKGDSPNFPVAYNPKGFTVTSREVPDRLPAGTIVRLTDYPDLRLITDKGGIHLSGYVNPNPEFRDGSDYTAMVKRGEAEVIYLPES